MDSDLFPTVAAAVGECAVNAGIARRNISRDAIYQSAKNDIDETHRIMNVLSSENIIKRFPENEIKRILDNIIDTLSIQ